MLKSAVIAAALIAAWPMTSASALPGHAPITAPAAVTTVAQGCGPGFWRGPWGGCRDTPYTGPLPYGGYAVVNNGCPPGFWRGPWGNCRNTPFHGRLPDGYWQ